MIGATSFENVTRDCAEAGGASPGVTRTAISHAFRSVSEKCEHALGTPAPPAKNGRNSQVIPREARLLGAREVLLRRAPRGGTDSPRGASSRMRQDTPGTADRQSSVADSLCGFGSSTMRQVGADVPELESGMKLVWHVRDRLTHRSW